ncbi:MAG: YceD family protein [Actinomycetota bacterium]|nr:YceD family protein [Actinomycetota bacterium]
MNNVVIDVSGLMEEIGSERHLSFEKEFLPIETEATKIEFVEPVKFDISLISAKGGVRVKGHIKSALKLVCSRCLNEFSFPVDWQIDEVFTTEEIKGEESLTIRNGAIDLGPPVEEEFVLAIPIKPLCSEACQGICPICGQIITGKHKPHEEVKIDARLEMLKKLLKNEEG